MPFVALIDATDRPPATDRWYIVADGTLLVDRDVAIPAGAEPDLAPLVTDVDPIFLGELDGSRCWALGATGSPRGPAPGPGGSQDGGAGVTPGGGAGEAISPSGPAPGAGADADPLPAPAGHQWIDLRRLGMVLSTEEWHLAGRAVQLVEWDRTSRFCGRCGTVTQPSSGERARRCPNCGLLAYPRLAPAVIVAVERGREILLGHNARFPRGRLSLIAGFVEPGETFEDTVRREVAEEVGVQLGELRYVSSQPWPFPHQVMVGFRAKWESGEIHVDGHEIVEAGWYTPETMPPLPPPLTIARRIIEGWLADAGAG